jgi:hypothetical protein
MCTLDVDAMRRADVDLALDFGVPTQFQVEILPGHSTVSWLRDVFLGARNYRPCDAKVVERIASASLQGVFVDILSFAYVLNGRGEPATLDAFHFHDVLVLLNSRLVCLSPLAGPRFSDYVQDALHLSLSAFMAEFLLQFGRAQVNYPLLSQSFRASCRQEWEESRDVQELLLWMLFIGKITVLKPEDDAWLLPRVTLTIRTLGLKTWTDAYRILGKFPWIGPLHDIPGKALWNKTGLRPIS